MRLATCYHLCIRDCLEAHCHGGNLLLLQEEAQSLRIPTRLLTVLKETVQSPASAAAGTASSSLPSIDISSPPLGMAVMPAKPLPGTLQHAAIANGNASASASGSTAGPLLRRAANPSKERAPTVAVRGGHPLNGTAKQEAAGAAIAAEVKGAVEEAACTEALGMAIAGNPSAPRPFVMYIC